MEFAAKLADITIDCTEMFRSGETADEDASAVSTALTICREIWNDQNFTAGEVTKALAIGASREDLNVDDLKSTRAIALADALGELAGAGKRLEKPTAHSIGKLAILRKSAGHQENKYRVELLAPGHAAHPERSEADFADRSKNNPDNPNNPRAGSPNGFGPGNLGKVGNGSGDFPGEKDSSLANGSKKSSSWSARI
jgi:hypothetical protein